MSNSHNIPKIIATEIITSFLTTDGKEINNPTPLVCHTGLNRPLTLDERVDRMLAIKMSQHNKKLGGESIEEAMDFDVQDEFESEPAGPHDWTEMQEEYLAEPEPEKPSENKPAEPEPAEPDGNTKPATGNIKLPAEPELNQQVINVADGKLIA